MFSRWIALPLEPKKGVSYCMKCLQLAFVLCISLLVFESNAGPFDYIRVASETQVVEECVYTSGDESFGWNGTCTVLVQRELDTVLI